MDVLTLIADTYREAALARLDMRRAVELLEPLHAALEGDRFKAWKALDDGVGAAFTTATPAVTTAPPITTPTPTPPTTPTPPPSIDASMPLATILSDLRRRYVAALLEEATARVRAVFETDAEAGWRAWLNEYALALSEFRLEYLRQWCGIDLPFRPEHAAQRDQFREMTACMLSGRYSEAYPVFEQLAADEQLPPEHRAQYFVNRAQISLYYFYDPKRARELWTQARELAPDDYYVVMFEGEMEIDARRYAEARSILRRATMIRSNYADAYVYIGDTFEREGDVSAAEQAYWEAVAHAPGDPGAYTRAIRLRRDPDLYAARTLDLEAMVRRAAIIEPRIEAEAYIELAGVYRENDETERALEWINRALEIDQTRIDAYTWKIEVLWDTGRTEEAFAAAEKLVNVAPDAPDGYTWVATLHERAERWDAALAAHQQALERTPEGERIAARARIANVYVQQGDHERAETESLAVLRQQPENASALATAETLAVRYASRDPDAALRVLDAIREIVGESYEDDYHNRIGNMRYDQGRYAEALESYRRAIAADGSNAVYHGNLGRALREAHDYQGARAAFEAAFRINKREREYKRELSITFNAEGNTLFDQKRYPEAVGAYERAVEFDPADAVIQGNLASALEKCTAADGIADSRAALIERAVVALEAADRIRPNGEYARRLERLRTARDLIPFYGDEFLDLQPPMPIRVYLHASLLPLILAGDQAVLNEKTKSALIALRTRLRDRYGVEIPAITFNEWEAGNVGGLALVLREVTYGFESIDPVALGGTPDDADFDSLMRLLETLLSEVLHTFIDEDILYAKLSAVAMPEARAILESPDQRGLLLQVIRLLLETRISVAALPDVCAAFTAAITVVEKPNAEAVTAKVRERLIYPPLLNQAVQSNGASTVEGEQTP